MKRVLSSDYASLETVVEDTEAYLSEFDVDEDLAYRVVLLATEAVTNAIEHGNDLDPEKNVIMECRCDPDRITLTVEDEGGGFDPSKLSSPLEEEHLLDPGGRGLFLMDNMADEVGFEEEGRRIRLVFFR
jgi:serine/threonine-protein kinase RsbW